MRRANFGWALSLLCGCAAHVGPGPANASVGPGPAKASVGPGPAKASVGPGPANEEPTSAGGSLAASPEASAAAAELSPLPASRASVRPPGAWLTRDEARRYMVDLVNRDRASMGVAPVKLDLAAPTQAGQAHAEDMASHGYLGHWGTDGSVPEQRLTEAGGSDMVLENASCFVDEKPRRLDAAPRIDAQIVEQAEAMFFHEQPPNDGHRKNILKPWHTKVGIGVAQPVATPVEIPVPCFAQEFVDSFGTFAPVPRTMHVGGVLYVKGSVAPPATFAGVALARVEAPKALAVSEANKRRSYPVPAPYQTYWPLGYKTPIAVKVDASGRFSVDIPLTDGGKAGMYELSIWATVPGSRELVMVSLRTIQAR